MALAHFRERMKKVTADNSAVACRPRPSDAVKAGKIAAAPSDAQAYTTHGASSDGQSTLLNWPLHLAEDRSPATTLNSHGSETHSKADDSTKGESQRLRVLILDDSETDVELMLRELKRAGVQFEHRAASTEKELLEAVDSFRPDVAVVDYCIPGYDGIAAIQAIHRKRPDIPVVVVSGRMGEEVAVETIKSGAFDYVLKSNLKRLPSAVLRAAREAEEQRAHLRTQIALRESEERFRNLVQLSPDAIYLTKENQLVFANPAGLKLLGAKSAEGVIGKPLDEQFLATIQAALAKNAGISSQAEAQSPMTSAIVRLDGTWVPVEINVATIWLHGQPMVQVVARDISERIEAEQALRRAYDEMEDRVKERTRDLFLANTKLEQEILERERIELELRTNRAFIDAVFTSLPGHMAVLDGNGVIIAVNDSWKRAAENRGASLEKVGVGVNYIEVCQRAAKNGEPAAEAALAGIQAVLKGQQEDFSLEYHGNDKDATLWAMLYVNALKRPEGGAVITHVDITKRKAAELEVQRLHQDLYRYGRVSLMGELAAAIAHELRQPLTALRTNAEAAMDLLGPGTIDVAELRDILGDMIADINRAAEVIVRMRGLLTKGKTTKAPLNVNKLVEEVIPLVKERLVMQAVTVQVNLASELPQINGDRIQLQQVLMNLIVNALDAMKSSPRAERRLTIRTELNQSKEVQVSVSDTGIGLPAGDPESIFESFYSTKQDGMGMGLAICRSIVQAHGGRIWAANNDGGGTTFYVALPVAG